MYHFWAQNGPFGANNFFFENYWYHSHVNFHCVKSWKNSSGGSRVMRMHNFLGPKWPISPNENFFRKPVNEPCFFHSCLSTCQKSKSDINLLVKYWQLKNTEISLAVIFGYNLRTRFFPSMQFSQDVNEP